MTAKTRAAEVPWLIRQLETSWGWRHVKGVAVLRALVALWLVFLGVVLCADGFWWGVSLFVAAAVAGWLAYEMPRWKLALDAEKAVEGSEPRDRVHDDSREPDG